MALAVLSIDLTAKMAQFEQDLKKAVVATEKVSADMRAAFGTVSAGLGLVGIAGVAGLGQILKASVDSVDALNDVADATGASIENISALEDTAARTGTSMDTVTTALVKFNGILKEAKPGSGQEEILKSIGLSAKELRDQDPAEALLEVAKALSQYEDDGQKARLVQELFGKSAKDLAPLLKDLAEKGKLVATVTTEQAAEAEKFNKQLFEMQKNAQDAGRYLTSDLVTGINKAAKAWRESGLVEGIRTFLTGDDQYKNDVALVEQTEQIAELERDITELKATGAATDKALATQKERTLKNLREELAVTLQYRKALAGTDAAEAPKPSAPGVPDSAAAAAAKSAADKARKERERAAKEEQDKARKERERAAKEEQDFRIKLGREWATEEGMRVQAENEAYQKQLADGQNENNNTIEATQKQTEALSDLLTLERDHIAVLGLSKQALADRMAVKLEEQADDKDRRAKVFEDIDLTGQQSEEYRAQAKALRELAAAKREGAAKEASIAAKTEADKLSKEAADTLQNDLKGAFSAAFRDTNGEPLQAFGDAIANVIYTRAATALADSLASSVLGMGGASSGGGFSSLLTAFTSFDGGGYTGGGARSGGLDGKGGFLSILHPNETVLDHTKGQRTGQQAQPLTFIQNFTVGDVATVSMVRQAVAGSERRIAGAMGRSMSYGGALG